MSTDAAHTYWWQTFEVIFGIPLLLGIALHLMFPRAFGDDVLTLIRVLAGLLLGGVSLLLVRTTRRAFRTDQQPTDPGRPTSKLITTGVFAYSRNPLYLGGVGVLVGSMLVLNLVWGGVLLLPALVACHVLLIQPEERYLAATFGEEYHLYAGRVNRWLGRACQPSA